MYRVIIQERCKNYEILPLLAPNLDIIRHASSIKADIIFLDAQPSLGLLVFNATASVTRMVKEIAQLQNTFTHSFVILCGCISDEKLTNLQLAIPSGSMRLFLTPTIQVAAKVALMHAELMTEKTKLGIQKQYFLSEATRVVSSTQALDVLHESLGRMSIPSSAIDLIATSYPSLSQVMTAEHAQIHYQVPCDESVARVLHNFFNASVSLSTVEPGSGTK